jgi:mannose-6-phosphate isomerase-like protein (cupin superfamily)
MAAGAERQTDATWIRRTVSEIQPQKSDVTAAGCLYRPVFGAGDPDARLLKGIARFGQIEMSPGGSCAEVAYPAEEQVYVVLDGAGSVKYGKQELAVKKHDFVYMPPGVPHSMAKCSEVGPCRVVVMGFRIPAGTALQVPEKPMIANIGDVQKQTVAGHPPSTLYQLLIGDTKSKRDKIAAGHVLTSLFVMEFDAGGTNLPHHHEREEEVYLVLDGHGDMVAGGGIDGLEGRHPAKAGDAYFFRLNCTVGFYSGNKPGEAKSRILAVRSLFPMGRK